MLVPARWLARWSQGPSGWRYVATYHPRTLASAVVLLAALGFLVPVVESAVKWKLPPKSPLASIAVAVFFLYAAVQTVRERTVSMADGRVRWSSFVRPWSTESTEVIRFWVRAEGGPDGPSYAVLIAMARERSATLWYTNSEGDARTLSAALNVALWLTSGSNQT